MMSVKYGITGLYIENAIFECSSWMVVVDRLEIRLKGIGNIINNELSFKTVEKAQRLTEYICSLSRDQVVTAGDEIIGKPFCYGVG